MAIYRIRAHDDAVAIFGAVGAAYLSASACCGRHRIDRHKDHYAIPNKIERAVMQRARLFLCSRSRCCLR